MATLKFIGFIGELPRLMPRVLPDMAAQEAINTRLTTGGLEPIRQPKRIVAAPNPPAGDVGTIFRFNNSWLSWNGLVHMAPGPVADNRLYYTGDGAPKLRNANTSVVHPLKVGSPSGALVGSVNGTGNGDVETRLYVYTHVTDFGEESQPSPISEEILWEPGQTVTLSGFQIGDTSRLVSKQRIYRSQTSASGDTRLFFIAERSSSTADFTDNAPLEGIVEPLPTTAWTPPPDSLEGLTAMPNGMMAAFVGKTLYFSEPYRPHAWPSIYTLVVDYDIVGLGAFGTSLAVLTLGNPYVVTGSHPESMVMEKLELNLPCVTPWGIVDLGYAIAYPSHDGLVVVSSSGAQVATEQLFSRDDWQSYNPGGFSSGNYDGRYYASYAYTDVNNEERKATIIIDLSGEQAFVIRAGIITRSFYYEIETGYLYYLFEGIIYQWDAPYQPNEIQTWRSKEIVMPRPTNFGAIMIEAIQGLSGAEIEALLIEAAEAQSIVDDIYDSDDSLGGAISASDINGIEVNGDTLPFVPEIDQTAGTLSVNVYADGVLRATVSRVNQTSRLPGGFKARKWEVEVTGNLNVEQVALATTGVELAGI